MKLRAGRLAPSNSVESWDEPEQMQLFTTEGTEEHGVDENQSQGFCQRGFASCFGVAEVVKRRAGWLAPSDFCRIRRRTRANTIIYHGGPSAGFARNPK